MALPGLDAGIRLRAAFEPAIAAVFHETDSRRTAKGIFEIAGLFVARPIRISLSGPPSAMPVRLGPRDLTVKARITQLT